jgi:N-hydroxyarylamine O-acetyltransferase
MMPVVDVSQYLERIGFDAPISVDLPTLAALQRTHLSAVAFENLDVFGEIAVRTDLDWSLDKIVRQRRGGWCFEVNGAFSALLRAIGFDVRLLGAAVLLDGPNELIDHLTLEVTLDQSYLVDVGFGENFISPLELNRPGSQDGGSGTFELIGSAQGLTLTRHDEDGVPTPQYRFKRVDRSLEDFDGASLRLRSDPNLHWRQKPFATRLLDGGPDRVTLLSDRIKVTVDGETTVTSVDADKWHDVLLTEFDMVVEADSD